MVNERGRLNDVLATWVRTHGGATYGNLRNAGFTQHRIRAAVEAGAVVRSRHGHYAPAAPAWTSDVMTADRLGGVVSHLSAAAWHGWELKVPPERLSLTVQPGHPGRLPTIVDAHWSDLSPCERVQRAPVTAPIRTVIDCARSLPFDEALAVADSALRAEAMTELELRAAVDALPRAGDRVRRVVRCADVRAANPFESVLRAEALGVNGLRVIPQCWIDSIGRVDLYDPHLRIVIEADSYAYHSSPQQLRRDVVRYTSFTCSDRHTLRFTWQQVMFEPVYVRLVLAQTVAVCTAYRR